MVRSVKVALSVSSSLFILHYSLYDCGVVIKRIACALLCLLLALPGLCRAEDAGQIDIAALMARQVSGNSAFRAQLTAELSEAAAAGIDAAL